MCTSLSFIRFAVIVVDVEDRDDSAFANLTPYEGGLSGWSMLWDKLCPVPRFRCAEMSQGSQALIQIDGCSAGFC